LREKVVPQRRIGGTCCLFGRGMGLSRLN